MMYHILFSSFYMKRQFMVENQHRWLRNDDLAAELLSIGVSYVDIEQSSIPFVVVWSPVILSFPYVMTLDVNSTGKPGS